MNFRSQVVLELVKNERTFTMAMPVGATFDDCLDVCSAFQKQIESLKQADAEAAKAKEVLNKEE